MQSTVNVSLPPALRNWVKRQVEARGFSTASEFVRDIIRRERENSMQAQVDRVLLDAIQTPITVMTDRDWDEIAQEGRKLAGSARKRGKK